MCAGIAFLWSELPLELIEAHGLSRRAHERSGEREVRFLYRDRIPLLPAWHHGQLILARWGSRRRGAALPCTGWTWKASVLEGKWGQWGAEAVEIPATFGWENGVWFSIRRGIEGVLVRDTAGTPVVYMVCEPPTRYFNVMTRSTRMPALIGQTI
jgi:hypothetical protein